MMGQRFNLRCNGTVLVIALIMLLLLTILGLAAMRGTLLQERMAGNVFLQHRALQGAEAGLRFGELAVPAAEDDGIVDIRCTNSRFGRLEADDPAPAEWQCFAVFAPRNLPYRINGLTQREFGVGPVLRVDLYGVEAIGRVWDPQNDPPLDNEPEPPLAETQLATTLSIPDF